MTIAPAELDDARENTRRGFVLTGLLLKIVADFESAGVRMISLKGPVLAQFLYGDPSARSYEDLDIFVRREDVSDAVCVLEQNGYRLDTPLDWLTPAQLTKVRSEVRLRHHLGSDVDLHWEVAPNDYPFRIDSEILWSSVQPVRIAGREVPSLTAECLVLFLCVHGSKHAWARRTWVRDVASLIGGNQIDWNVAMNLARRASCERPLLLGVLLARNLFSEETRIPQDVLDQARAISIIARFAVERAEGLRAAIVREPSGWEMVKFNVRLSPSVWAKLKHVAGLLHAPTEADARLLRLPHAFFCLYYPFRLFRLIGKYLTRDYGFHPSRASSVAPGAKPAE